MEKVCFNLKKNNAISFAHDDIGFPVMILAYHKSYIVSDVLSTIFPFYYQRMDSATE